MSDHCEMSLQFGPFSSFIHPSFWSAFSKKKLEELGLSQEPVSVLGRYCNNDPKGMPAALNLEWDSLDDSLDLDPASFVAVGKVINLNTIEDFKQFNKNKMVDDDLAKLRAMMRDDSVLENPQQFSRFCMLMHADLKKYLYYYLFAFPVLMLPDEVILTKEPAELRTNYTSQTLTAIENAILSWKRNCSSGLKTGFCVLQIKDTEGEVNVLSLKEGIDLDEGIVCFADPWTKTENPGWPARNFLAYMYLRKRNRLKNLKLLCFRREVRNRESDIGSSILLHVSLKGATASENEELTG